jgi:hypothetical protein
LSKQNEEGFRNCHFFTCFIESIHAKINVTARHENNEVQKGGFVDKIYPQSSEVAFTDEDGIAALEKLVAWLREHKNTIRGNEYSVKMVPPIDGHFEAKVLFFKE